MKMENKMTKKFFIPNTLSLSNSSNISVPIKNIINRVHQIKLGLISRSNHDHHERYVDEPRHDYYSDTPPPANNQPYNTKS